MFGTTLVFVSCGIHFSNVFIVRWRVSLWRYAWQRCRITVPNIIHYVSIKWPLISHEVEPLTRSLRVLFVVSLKHTAENKQPSCRWFEMPWRSCDVTACLHFWPYSGINSWHSNLMIRNAPEMLFNSTWVYIDLMPLNLDCKSIVFATCPPAVETKISQQNIWYPEFKMN